MTPIRILHLEDDANDAELIAMHLTAHAQAWPHHIVQVQTQKEFSAALEKSSYDVVLADNSGPSFSGHDALALVREKRPDSVFLFVSGYPDGGLGTAAVKTEADGYVVKDRLQDLIPAMQRALDAKKK